MYQVTIKGKPYGKKYRSSLEAQRAVARLWPVMHGLGWKKCEKSVSRS